MSLRRHPGNIGTPTPHMIRGLHKWARHRSSPAVRELALRFPPWRLYRLRETGQYVTVLSFGVPLDGGPVTLTVYVGPEFNFCIFPRSVFGINPESLEDVTELPTDGMSYGRR